ncbi:MAG TPA: hypothetical protein VGI63_08395 [Verrucomicrobiae bacterium]
MKNLVGIKLAMKSKYLVIIFSLIAIGLPFAWSATEPESHLTDDVIRQRIVGIWLVDMHLSNGNSIVGTEVILLSGIITSKATLTIGENKEELEFTGTWQVKDGYLIETVKKSNTERIPVGEITRDKVITLDDKLRPLQNQSVRTVVSGLWPETQGFGASMSRRSLDPTPFAEVSIYPIDTA